MKNAWIVNWPVSNCEEIEGVKQPVINTIRYGECFRTHEMMSPILEQVAVPVAIAGSWCLEAPMRDQPRTTRKICDGMVKIYTSFLAFLTVNNSISVGDCP